MKVIEDAFTIIHIRISSVRIFGIGARHLVTGLLIVFLIFNTIRVFVTVFTGSIFSFIESSLFIILTIYFALMWIKAWPKAGKMLNKAFDYEHEYEHVDKKHKEK